MAGTCALGAASLRASVSQTPRFGVRTPFPNVSLRERALLAKRLGYDGIELGPEWLDQPVDAIQKELDGTDIAVSAIVGSLQLLNTDPLKRTQAIELDRQRLRMAKELKAGFMIEVPVFGPNQFQDLSPVMTPREIETKLLVAGLKSLAGDVKETGVTLLLEPLTRKETHFTNLQSQGAEIIHQVGAPGFKLLSDFYHMQLEEKDIGETLATYGGLTGYVHLADGERRTEPGSLPFDYRPGFHAVKKWGFSGWLTMESKATDNPEAALRRALAYVKRQWNDA
jgi:sugar phosphate isomerase/epimerase